MNLEYLQSLEDTDEAIERYVAFGVVQIIRSRVVSLKYDKAQKRPIDDELLARLERLLETDFAEFQGTRSWSGLSTRALAEKSPHAIRLAQYEQLFTAWSEEVHAAPSTLARGVLGNVVDRDLDAMLSEDEPQIAQVGAMATILFISLWRLLGTLPAAG